MPEKFTPPNVPAHFTGTLWRNADGTLGATISDVFDWPIHLIATKEDGQYHLRGWRGQVPDSLGLPLVDNTA